MGARAIKPYHRITRGVDNIYCKEHMRFTKTEIRQFLPYLQLDLVAFRNRCTATLEVALCLVL